MFPDILLQCCHSFFGRLVILISVILTHLYIFIYRIKSMRIVTTNKLKLQPTISIATVVTSLWLVVWFSRWMVFIWLFFYHLFSETQDFFVNLCVQKLLINISIVWIFSYTIRWMLNFGHCTGFYCARE